MTLHLSVYQNGNHSFVAVEVMVTCKVTELTNSKDLQTERT